MPETDRNEAQTSAIEHASGPMQVLAGPGSGKTYLTIRRIRHLIRHHGVSPDKILVITFTKTAAKEMEERFLKLTKREYPEVRFGTFHAVFYHILKKSGQEGLRLVTGDEKCKTLHHILKASGSGETENPELTGSLLKAIASVKNGAPREQAGKLLSGFGTELTAQFASIYDEYCLLMTEAGKIDFDDMILRCGRMLEERPEICAFWQDSFSHILVDEFQDISPLQYQILRRLALPRNNLFIVGDDDQSIYGFRGAGPDIMKQFIRDYPYAAQATLNRNYRCGGPIAKAAGRVIEDNKNRYKKENVALHADEGEVKLLSFGTKEEEHRYLLAEFKNKTEKELTECAVIFRTNAEALILSRELAAAKIPFQLKEKQDSLFEHPVSRDILTYLSFASDIKDKQCGKRSDFYRIMNKPPRYINRAAAQEELVSEQMLMEYYRNKTFMQETVKKLWSELRRIAGLRPYLAVDYIRTGIKYEASICEGRSAEERKRLKELMDEVQRSAVLFRTLREWMAYVEDYTHMLHTQEIKPVNGKNGPDVPRGLHLLTMHRSKGLEYAKVYLPDIRRGSMPNKKAVSPELTEEERRLLYVAMTRARETLEILYYGEPSPFIEKLLINK